MNFEKYDKFINENKYEMLFFEIYYNLSCNGDFKDLRENEEDLKKVIYFIHNTYLKDENHVDLCCLCDTAMEYIRCIIDEDNDFTVYDLLRIANLNK
jgi:hypothetical protein